MTETTRDKLIATSIQVMTVKGFNNTGIAEILSLTQVPKGSFYHYFKSKDDLGFAIIEHYGQELRLSLVNYLASTQGSALSRLKQYFELLLVYFDDNFTSCNCLLGNLGQELASQSPAMREAIFRHYRAIEKVLAEALRQAKVEGEIATSQNEEVLAKVFFASWEGCLVRAKLEQSAQPLREFIELYFTVVFPNAAASSLVSSRPDHPG